MKHFLYLIGIPGSGKTTLLRACLAGLPCRVERAPFAHTIYDRGVQLGCEREAFGGTDALAMNVQPLVEAWLRQAPYEAIVAEGDRLANDRFFNAVEAAGWPLTVAWLATPEEHAAQRRRARGSAQNESWLRGRITKVNRLAGRWATPLWMLDGALPLDLLVAQLSAHPAIVHLRGELYGERARAA